MEVLHCLLLTDDREGKREGEKKREKERGRERETIIMLI